jgi:transposase
LLRRRGLLYVGDCKMAALATRGELARAKDFYLTVLPLTGETSQAMPGWIETALANPQQLLELKVHKAGREETLGQGYEWRRVCQTELAGRTVKWQERVQLIRFGSVWESQQQQLEEKLKQAEQEIHRLTPAPRRGRKVYREEAALAVAVTQVLERHGVVDLLVVSWQEQRQLRERYVGRGRPGVNRAKHEEVKVRYAITAVRRREDQIAARKERLGWRVQVTNAPKSRLSLLDSLLTYREGWCLERDFHQLKAKPLGIRPLYLQKDEQILGMTRLLTLGLRALTWLEIRIREELKKRREQLAGLYDGQTKQTAQPTAVRLLRAISKLELTLSHVQTYSEEGWYLPPLPPLLRKTLDLLSLPCSLYENLAK